jgi:hypothetical protein
MTILLALCPADEKEEGILGSILLPSFHISMLSVDDHISRKYAFKVSTVRTHRQSPIKDAALPRVDI